MAPASNPSSSPNYIMLGTSDNDILESYGADWEDSASDASFTRAGDPEDFSPPASPSQAATLEDTEFDLDRELSSSSEEIDNLISAPIDRYIDHMPNPRLQAAAKGKAVAVSPPSNSAMDVSSSVYPPPARVVAPALTMQSFNEALGGRKVLGLNYLRADTGEGDLDDEEVLLELSKSRNMTLWVGSNNIAVRKHYLSHLKELVDFKRGEFWFDFSEFGLPHSYFGNDWDGKEWPMEEMNISLGDASKMRTVTIAFTENQVESMMIDCIKFFIKKWLPFFKSLITLTFEVSPHPATSTIPACSSSSSAIYSPTSNYEAKKAHGRKFKCPEHEEIDWCYLIMSVGEKIENALDGQKWGLERDFYNSRKAYGTRWGLVMRDWVACQVDIVEVRDVGKGNGERGGKVWFSMI